MIKKDSSDYKHITKRDLEIVEFVYMARYATKDIVRDVLFSPTTDSSCKERLRLLWKRGFLARRTRHSNQEPFIYYLGLKGRRFISNKLELDRKEYVDKVK